MPIIATVIGAEERFPRRRGHRCRDQLNMLQYFHLFGDLAGGCASILWKTAEEGAGSRRGHGHHRPERLKGLGIVDKVIDEPLGGAHRDPASMAGIGSVANCWRN
ncbi:hypothetical protein ACPA9J_33055 [Pseudomonas aeruginosa]